MLHFALYSFAGFRYLHLSFAILIQNFISLLSSAPGRKESAMAIEAGEQNVNVLPLNIQRT